MEPYLQSWNNEAIFSLILSRTTWRISSKTSLVVAFCDNVVIFQLLRSLKMDSNSNRWQVGSAVLVLVSNHKPRFCLTYMYIMHRQRVYSVLCIWHVTVLYQITYGNAYSTLWHHMVLCVDQKMAIIETAWYYKKSMSLCATSESFWTWYSLSV